MSDEIVFDDATLNKLHSVASGTCTAMRDKWAATITDDNKIGVVDEMGRTFTVTYNSSWSVADNQTKSNCLMKFIDMMDPHMIKKLVEEIRRLNKFEAESNHWKANHACEVERARVLKERPDMPLERIKAYDRMVELEKENEALKHRIASLENVEMTRVMIDMASQRGHEQTQMLHEILRYVKAHFKDPGYY